MYTPSRQFSKYNTSDETDTAVITIMVTESTANMLGMEKNIRLEDIDETEPHIHRILPNLHKFNSSSAETKYWFMSSTGHNATHNFYISQVMTDIAFFIDPQKFRNTESDSSIESVNDIDVDSVEDDNIKFEEEDHAILQKQKVLVRPLVTIKNSVQSNHLSWDANVIYVSRVDSLVEVANSGWMNVCRICHGGESVGSLLSPCSCRGSIALAHIECLEHWLRESSNSSCELCQHHFNIIRQPKYSVPWSIFVFLRHPGEHMRELLFDLLAFVLYTPSAITSTYMLMLLCENFAKANINNSRNICGHIVVFSAIFGMAAIDFTYSSWLMVCLQRQRDAWKEWYKTTCNLKVVLPDNNYKRRKRTVELSEDPD